MDSLHVEAFYARGMRPEVGAAIGAEMCANADCRTIGESTQLSSWSEEGVRTLGPIEGLFLSLVTFLSSSPPPLSLSPSFLAPNFLPLYTQTSFHPCHKT